MTHKIRKLQCPLISYILLYLPYCSHLCLYLITSEEWKLIQVQICLSVFKVYVKPFYFLKWWHWMEDAQSYLTLCDPMDCSLPDSSVYGIFQTRILEWVAMPFSRESFWPRDWTHVFCVSCIGRQILYHWATWETHLSHEWVEVTQSCPTLCDPMGYTIHGFSRQ